VRPRTPRGVPGLADHFDVGLFGERIAQRLAHQPVVVDE